MDSQLPETSALSLWHSVESPSFRMMERGAFHVSMIETTCNRLLNDLLGTFAHLLMEDALPQKRR